MVDKPINETEDLTQTSKREQGRKAVRRRSRRPNKPDQKVEQVHSEHDPKRLIEKNLQDVRKSIRELMLVKPYKVVRGKRQVNILPHAYNEAKLYLQSEVRASILQLQDLTIPERVEPSILSEISTRCQNITAINHEIISNRTTLSAEDWAKQKRRLEENLQVLHALVTPLSEPSMNEEYESLIKQHENLIDQSKKLEKLLNPHDEYPETKEIQNLLKHFNDLSRQFHQENSYELKKQHLEAMQLDFAKAQKIRDERLQNAHSKLESYKDELNEIYELLGHQQEPEQIVQTKNMLQKRINKLSTDIDRDQVINFDNLNTKLKNFQKLELEGFKKEVLENINEKAKDVAGKISKALEGSEQSQLSNAIANTISQTEQSNIDDLEKIHAIVEQTEATQKKFDELVDVRKQHLEQLSTQFNPMKTELPPAYQDSTLFTMVSEIDSSLSQLPNRFKENQSHPHLKNIDESLNLAQEEIKKLQNLINKETLQINQNLEKLREYESLVKDLQATINSTQTTYPNMDFTNAKNSTNQIESDIQALTSKFSGAQSVQYNQQDIDKIGIQIQQTGKAITKETEQQKKYAVIQERQNMLDKIIGEISDNKVDKKDQNVIDYIDNIKNKIKSSDLSNETAFTTLKGDLEEKAGWLRSEQYQAVKTLMETFYKDAEKGGYGNRLKADKIASALRKMDLDKRQKAISGDIGDIHKAILAERKLGFTKSQRLKVIKDLNERNFNEMFNKSTSKRGKELIQTFRSIGKKPTVDFRSKINEQRNNDSQKESERDGVKGP